jgi:predicted nucleotidyltransferase component of viral defense system
MADIAASVLSKLHNKAKETGRSYQLCLQLFCQEEFLRRVSLTKYVDNLILKGGLFIYTLTGFESRATVDVDFLIRQISNTESEIMNMVKKIASVDTGNGFITFQIKGISPITLQRKYNGFSVAITGMIKNTQTPFNIDFGIGDVIVPKPEKRKIPTQLDGFKQPEISTYSLESTIAEKFDAIITRFEFTSRMKDFYDIFYLASTFDFEGRQLQEAIFGTLQNRRTSYDRDTFDNIGALASSEAMIVRWKAFLNKIKTVELNFDYVLRMIQAFLKPVFEAMIEEREFVGKWSCKERTWVGAEGAKEE